MTTIQTMDVRDVTDTQTRANSKADKKAVKLAAAKAAAAERQRAIDAKLAENEAKRKRDKAEAEAALAKQGKMVAELVSKINREELAAANDYLAHTGEADSIRETLGKKLAEVEPMCKSAKMSFADFKAKYVGDLLGRTQVYQLMAVAKGKITFEEIRKLESERQRNKRERDAAKLAATVTSDRADDAPAKITATDGSSVKLSDLGSKAQAQIRSAGNGGEEGDEAHIAAMAKIAAKSAAEEAGEPPPTQTTAEPVAPHVETAIEKSDRLLKEWKERMAGMLDGMKEDDFKSAVAWWSAYLKKRTTVLPVRR